MNVKAMAALGKGKIDRSSLENVFRSFTAKMSGN
jgi:hypothetical protein